MTTVPATIRERIDLSPAPPSSVPVGVTEHVVTVQDVLGILRRRSLLITFLFILFAGMATGVWFAAREYVPLYLGEAYVECISDRPKTLDLTGETPGQKEFDRFMLTQAQYVKSPNVLTKTLQTPEVRATAWFRDTPEEVREIKFYELVKAAPQRGTSFLRIWVETHSAGDPHEIVNQVVRQYLSTVREDNTGDYRRDLDSRREELEDIEDQIAAKQLQLGEIQKQLPPGVTTFGGNIIDQDYIEQQRLTAQLKLDFEGLRTWFEMYQQGRVQLTPQDIMIVEQDPQVAFLANQFFTLSQQLEVGKNDLGPRHREIKRLEQALDVVNRDLEQLRQRRINERIEFNREQLSLAYANSQDLWLKSQTELLDKEAYLKDVDARMVEFQKLAEDVGLLKLDREEIDDAIAGLNRVVKEKAAVRVEPRQMARPPLATSFPRRWHLAAGGALALVFAIGIALLLEFVDTSLRTPQDIVRHLHVPLLGVVPDADDEEVNIKQVETAVRDYAQTMFVEAIRTIRTNLQFSTTADRQRSIVISSPRPEDGKTAMACNLAMMLAQGGRRVLLVDANFRRPAIQQFFPTAGAGGLSNVLVGDGRFEDLAVRSEWPQLDILGSGPLPPNPADLVGSVQMQEFIAAATKVYDQVIFDAPPVLLASDAALLASNADGVILVCRAKSNSRGIGARACGLLSRVDAHLFGVILNAAQVRRGGYFREQLRTYYDYQPEERGRRRGRRAKLPEQLVLSDGDPDSAFEEIDRQS